MELRQYVAVIWRWLWLIVLGIVLAAGTAYVVSDNMVPHLPRLGHPAHQPGAEPGRHHRLHFPHPPVSGWPRPTPNC